MYIADARGSSRRPPSPRTLAPKMRYYLLLDLNGTLCDIVRAPCASKIKQIVIVFREGVEDFQKYCSQHFEVYFWSSCQKKKMLKIMSKLEAETGHVILSNRLLSQDKYTVSKYRDSKNHKDFIFLRTLQFLSYGAIS